MLSRIWHQGLINWKGECTALESYHKTFPKLGLFHGGAGKPIGLLVVVVAVFASQSWKSKITANCHLSNFLPTNIYPILVAWKVKGQLCIFVPKYLFAGLVSSCLIYCSCLQIPASPCEFPRVFVSLYQAQSVSLIELWQRFVSLLESFFGILI